MRHHFKFISKRPLFNSPRLIQLGFGMAVMFLLTTTGCNDDDDPGNSPDNGKPITLETEATELFNALQTFFPAYMDDLPATEFGSPPVTTTLAGNGGTATVSYTREVTSQSSSQGTTSSDGIRAFITFEDFEPEGMDMRITGPVRFFWVRSSRTRSTGFTSEDSRAIETRPAIDAGLEFIEISYQLDDGTWLNDVINIDAASPGWTNSWTEVEISTDAGEFFSL